MKGLHISAVDPCGADALALLYAAALEARALYPELFTADSPAASNTATPPRGLYLLAYLDSSPVACGAFRPLDTHAAELRRLFVRTDARRSGIALALLERLQADALAFGYTRLVLETGHKQLPAMALYERFGFKPIAPFGDYTGDPTSRCFEKQLA